MQVQPLNAPIPDILMRLCDQGWEAHVMTGLDSRGIWELLLARSCTVLAGECYDLQAEEPVQSAGIGEPAR